jgi:diguanylate cyclase (GGDEF)-like protein
VLLLPGTDLEGGTKLAERIRQTLAEHEFAGPDAATFHVSASFGVAAFPDAPSEDQLVSAADAALYDAKRSGKNRIGSGPVTVSSGT